MGNQNPHYPNLAGGRITTATGGFAVQTVPAPFPGRTIRSVNVTIEKGTAPALTSGLTITYTVDADGSITFYLWRPTTNADATLIAATTTTTFSWFAVAD